MMTANPQAERNRLVVIFLFVFSSNAHFSYYTSSRRPKLQSRNLVQLFTPLSDYFYVSNFKQGKAIYAMLFRIKFDGVSNKDQRVYQ